MAKFANSARPAATRKNLRICDSGLQTFRTTEKPLVLHPRTRWQSKLRETGKIDLPRSYTGSRFASICYVNYLEKAWSPRGPLIYFIRFWLRDFRARDRRRVIVVATTSSGRRRRVGRRRVPSLGIDARCGSNTRTKSAISSPLGTYQTLVKLAIYPSYAYPIVLSRLVIADRVESRKFPMRRPSDHTRSSTTWSNKSLFPSIDAREESYKA